MKAILTLCTGVFLAGHCLAQPAIGYASSLGGSGLTQALASAVDTNGNTYVTGNTLATNLATPGAFQSNFIGTRDAFVAEFNSAGALMFLTYLGGSGAQSGQGLSLDDFGDILVTGYTSSTNFPTKNPLQPTNAGGYDAFLTAVAPGGGALVYSTYLGGEGFDAANGIGVDTNNEPVITGYTLSTHFPVANPAQPTNGGSGDAFVAKVSSDGGSFIYSTYFGGKDSENNGSTELNGIVSSLLSGLGGAVAVGSDGSAYITGWTYSTNLPVTNAFQATNQFAFSGAAAAYVAKFDPMGNLDYSTYFGGYLFDYGRAIGVDVLGNVYFGGSCETADLPVTNAFQPVFHGGYNGGVGDAYLAALDATGTNLLYCTYFGGAGNDEINGLAVTPDGRVVVTGCSDSPDLPTLDAIQSNAYMGFLATTNDGESWIANSTDFSYPVVRALALDPFDSSTLYAVASFLYKSVDKGKHWTAIDYVGSGGSYYSAQGLLAFDPAHPGTLYYGAYYSLQKTTDGGATWTTLTSGLPSPAGIQAVAVDPHASSTLYVATYGGGVFKSINSGTNWTAMNTGLNNLDVTALLVDPANSSNVFAGLDNYASVAVYKSTNGGNNWAALSGLPSYGFPVVALACSPGNSSAIYALLGDFFNSATLCLTTNGGSSWSQPLQLQLGQMTSLAALAPPQPVLSIATLGSMVTLSWPASLTGFALQTSTTLQPALWQNIAQTPVVSAGYASLTLPANATDGFYRLTYTNKSPRPSYVYVGCDQPSLTGLLRSANGGASWTQVGLAGDTITAVTADPTDPSVIYTGLSAGYDAFVASFTADGQLSASTYTGGSGFDQGNSVNVNGSDAFVFGFTLSPEFSPTPAVPHGVRPLFSIFNPAAISPPIGGGGSGKVDIGSLLVEDLRKFVPCPTGKTTTRTLKRPFTGGAITIAGGPPGTTIVSETGSPPAGMERRTIEDKNGFQVDIFGAPTGPATYNYSITFHLDPDCTWTDTFEFVVE